MGLAQNLAAIRALATEGIQRGHMALHARQVAIAAGAAGDEVDRVAAALVAERHVRADRAASAARAEMRQADDWTTELTTNCTKMYPSLYSCNS